MKDKKIGLSKEDIELTKSFYNTGKYFKNIFAEKELHINSVTGDFPATASDSLHQSPLFEIVACLKLGITGDSDGTKLNPAPRGTIKMIEKRLMNWFTGFMGCLKRKLR